VCRTPEELKAWSQNLGHEDVMTTLRSYGEVPSPRQAEIIRNLHQASEPDMDAAAALKALETIVRRTTSGLLLRRIWAPANQTDIERTMPTRRFTRGCAIYLARASAGTP
jgi:hypothetical protein